jgi:hypothetical protein
MAAWRLARSLETLRNQVNAAYPRRSKASDGTIGDASHAASASDHNPNRNGVVCALDLTHDPTNGFDAHALAEHLRTHRHPNLRYIISNARIAGWWTNWQWQPSSGHTNHVHISVGTLGVGDGQTYDRYDDTTNWNLKETSAVKREDAVKLKNVMRVLNSEAKGWDRASVHAGKSDEQEIKYLMSLNLSPIDAIVHYSQQAWNEGKKYREDKDKWKKAFDGQPALVKEIADLKKKIEQGGDGEAAKKLQAIKDALK